MDNFPTEWLHGLIGGLLIGCASAFYLFFNGRIAGVSGILGNLLSNSKNLSSVSFLIGLIFTSTIFMRFFWESEIIVSDSWIALLLGGLLVGFGTRLGNGCTSGHGVCGISRLSIRSIIATCTFMFFAMLTVYITHHHMGEF
ncbi:YeeE/YedE family protein [Curvivirga aplysinae]|uniref:YeeE/YedE family protein n=1 Tax=Curvivirga aplysinae TaxID=2529852 RepID=UPI0012BC9471|nr:YeeE/YedE thiosulfate transporter family protein [Curvivirga aplysinae]MTI08787.1 YeeE/YedE family protein [Curvivirga aplysinae]